MYDRYEFATTVELPIDAILDEVGITDILEAISNEDICKYLTEEYESEDLVEMLDIRVNYQPIKDLDETEKQALLWELLKEIKL